MSSGREVTDEELCRAYRTMCQQREFRLQQRATKVTAVEEGMVERWLRILIAAVQYPTPLER